MKTSYVNLNFEENPNRLRDDIFGPDKLARLQRIKAEYDPTNIFFMNWNIPPMTAADR